MTLPNPESRQPAPVGKPKLLVVELWGVGDLAIATPFLRAASEKFEVTLLAKPFALDLRARFWSAVKVVPFTAPWTAFKRKYQLFSWPWLDIIRLRKLVAERFAVGLSARWDPRDHILLTLVRAKKRVGFPRVGSQVLLTQPLARPDPLAHRYENWRVLAHALELKLPDWESFRVPQEPSGDEVLVHTGAGQPVRVWPLDRYRNLVAWMREQGYRVQVACDPDQRNWWLLAGEPSLVTPQTVSALLDVVNRAAVFIGNDSGPGHLAALCGVPTFTLFGPQLPEWFAPLHPTAQWLEGKACPYKPCSDYCRFPVPCCVVNSGEEEVRALVKIFLERNHPRTMLATPDTGTARAILS